MFNNSNSNVILFLILAIFMIHFQHTLSSEAVETNETNDPVQFTDNGQISIKLSSVIDLLKKFWDWDITGATGAADSGESRTFGFRRRMIMNTLVPFAFFLGKMTMVIMAIKLIGLINLKIGMMLLIVNFGILLAKLLALKKHHHGDGGQAHYYFNFSSPPAAYKPHYHVKASHPKNDFYNKLWDDLHHRSDLEHLDSTVYSTQIPPPYYGSAPEQVRYSAPIPPYPQQYQQAYNQRQLLSIEESLQDEQEREFLLARQQELRFPSTTTSQDLSTILDQAMSKLKKN